MEATRCEPEPRRWVGSTHRTGLAVLPVLSVRSAHSARSVLSAAAPGAEFSMSSMPSTSSTDARAGAWTLVALFAVVLMVMLLTSPTWWQSAVSQLRGSGKR